MKRILTVMFIMVISMLFVLGGCFNNNENPDESTSDNITDGTEPGVVTSSPNDETKGGETDPPTARLPLFWLQWSGSSLPRPGSGENCKWNWISASRLHVNIMSVHYLAKYEDGKTIEGIPDPRRLETLAELMKYELEKSEESGVAVIGYEDTVQFHAIMAAELGYKIEDLAVKNKDGSYAYTTAWNSGCYLACVNSPEWTDWQTKNITVLAKAGFAGVQYDFHPYAAAGFFCQCDNCKELWADYSKSKLGTKQDMPEIFDFSTELGREYYKWKIKCFSEFMVATVSEAKKINPDFALVMNQNANGYSFAFESLAGAWEIPSGEFHGVKNGYESTLFMYQLAEALGHDILYTIYNSPDQTTPAFRYKVNAAEAYSVIGGITYISDGTDNGANMFNYLYDNQEKYIETKSGATAAVLYSAESNFFSLPHVNINYGSQLYELKTDRARQSAVALMKSGVCYDYLAVEMDDAAEKLKKYDLLVLPAYTYFNENSWKPIIEAAIENGTRIVAVGESAEKFLKSLNLPENADVVYVSNFLNRVSEDKLTVGDDFKIAIADTAAAKKLVLSNNLENTSATIRTTDENHTYIHIVRRGSEKNNETWSQSLKYTLPTGATVKEITLLCPFTKDNKVDFDWSVKDGVLSVDIKDYDTYAAISVITE